MTWYHFAAYFFAGLFLANGVPHYVMGMTGRMFPTPFSKPPGTGESPAQTNVLWALGNFFAAFLLLQVGTFRAGLTWSMLALGLGVLVTSIMLVGHFGKLYSPGQ